MKLLGASLAACIAAAPVSLALAQAPTRATVEQKEALVRRLLTDSPAVVRIDASPDAEAKEYFRIARERHARAVSLLQGDELTRAEAELNEAMWLAGKARQRVPDPMLRAIELRFQNRAMMRAIESLRASYEAHLARLRGDQARSDATLARIAARIDEAQGYASSEHVGEANAVLRSVERELMAALGAVLGSTTIDYRARFDSPAEEFAFEQARHGGYAELVPVARTQLRPGREADAAMERHGGAAAAAAERAARHAAQRDWAAALDAIRQATAQLQAALAAAGLALPRDAASQGNPR